MTVDSIRAYCLQKKGTEETMPFDDNVLVYKVLGKAFLLTGLDGWERQTPSVNLKCDPEYAQELRGEYDSIEPGFHMNKKHWNTLYLEHGELALDFIFELIDHSYDMVVKGMTKKMRASLDEL